MKRNCEKCKKEFEAQAYKVKSGGGKFCSRPCANSALGSSSKGRKHSKEIREKISRNRLGIRPSLETRKKLSMALKGEKSPHWKGGKKSFHEALRRTLEYKLWRESVFKRDNYTCVWCGDNRGGNLEADHIKPFSAFPELRFAIDNGRTLCHQCHLTTDTYGNKAKKYVIE